LSPDKENNKRLNITPQAFESVMFKRFCFRRSFMLEKNNLITIKNYNSLCEEASYMYRVGWNISKGSLIANVSLAILLIIIGVLLYKEHIGLYQIIGIVCCMVGLIFVNLK
jgi:hypothetical protein